MTTDFVMGLSGNDLFIAPGSFSLAIADEAVVGLAARFDAGRMAGSEAGKDVEKGVFGVEAALAAGSVFVVSGVRRAHQRPIAKVAVATAATAPKTAWLRFGVTMSLLSAAGESGASAEISRGSSVGTNVPGVAPRAGTDGAGGRGIGVVTTRSPSGIPAKTWSKAAMASPAEPNLFSGANAVALKNHASKARGSVTPQSAARSTGETFGPETATAINATMPLDDSGRQYGIPTSSVNATRPNAKTSAAGVTLAPG